jgi:hypothetical protein
VAPSGGIALPRVPLEDEPADSLLQTYLKASPPWLISAVVQMLLIIVLGVWFLPPPKREGVHLDAFYADREGNELSDDPLSLDGPKIDDMAALTPVNLKEVSDPFAAPPKLDINLTGSAPSSDIVAPQIGLALAGREEGMRRALMEAYGGTPGTEAAVKNALDWLVKQQLKDGSWSLKGPYADGVSVENATAATAMALLAFQGNGHTHKKGVYQKPVDDGVKFLLKMQAHDGSFFRDIPGNSRFYTQGQCTIALCELYGMTGDRSLREPCEKAVEYCVKTQDSLGGWRYVPGTDSDTSVTGWIMMGLQSARMARLEVPSDTLARIGKYLDEASKESNGARYSYIPGAATTEVMTAEGLLCRQYLGWSQHDDRLLDGAKFLVSAENLPDWNNRNVYYWYYATQMLHHLEGPPWQKWNGIMRQLLVDKQVRSGKERGSWDPLRPVPDRWGGHAGRLYVTCLSTYILEVYYRHLPLYSGVRMQQQ